MHTHYIAHTLLTGVGIPIPVVSSPDQMSCASVLEGKIALVPNLLQ